MARPVSTDLYDGYTFFDFMYDDDDLGEKLKKVKQQPDNYDGCCAKCYTENVGTAPNNSLILVMDRQVSFSDMFSDFASTLHSSGYVLVYDYENDRAVLFTVLNQHAGQRGNIRFHVNIFREIPF